MERAMIIGNAGGGKSRLARHLSKFHHLPLTVIDRIRWRPGWVRVPEDEFAARHARLIAADRWIIDGWGSWESVIRRLDASDTIILIDLPFRQHLLWALRRQLTSFLTGGRDDPEGCPRWPHTLRLLRMMRAIDRDDLPRLRAEVAKRQGRARVIHLRSRADLDDFTRNEKGPGA